MDSKQIAFLIYLILTLGFFAYTTIRISKLFKLTKADPVRWDKIPQRITHTLAVAIGQTKILRKPIAGLLHALVFWGFIVITFGTLEMIIDGVAGTERIFGVLGPVYDGIVAFGEIFAGIIILASVIFLARRYITKPKRFEAPEMKPSSRMDATVIIFLILLLMFSLVGMNIGYLLTSTEEIVGFYPISEAVIDMFSDMSAENQHLLYEVNWWIHIGLVLIFLNILPYSKHFHVLTSVPNVFFKSLEAYGKLPNMESVKKEVEQMMKDPYAAPAGDAGEPARFGVKDAEDITWKNLLDSYTCTECGRCTAACPANITGKKLSPRKLYIDLRKRMTEKGPKLANDSSFDDGKTIFDYIDPEELWACTSCGACMQECPVEIEHVPFIVSMRQYLAMEEAKAPSQLNAMFSNIENNGAPWAMPASSRFDWAEGISVPE